MSRITDMIFFLDNFDVNFSNCVNRFVLALIITILYSISMSGSVFHIILLLSYHLHFGFNSQNQEIISKTQQIDFYLDE